MRWRIERRDRGSIDRSLSFQSFFLWRSDFLEIHKNVYAVAGMFHLLYVFSFWSLSAFYHFFVQSKKDDRVWDAHNRQLEHLQAWEVCWTASGFFPWRTPTVFLGQVGQTLTFESTQWLSITWAISIIWGAKTVWLPSSHFLRSSVTVGKIWEFGE